jgi:hypothetical protein
VAFERACFDEGHLRAFLLLQLLNGGEGAARESRVCELD